MMTPFQSWYEIPAQQRRSYPYHPSLFGVPVHPVDPTREALHPGYVDRQPTVQKQSGRKVVQIPVQFFGSECDRRSESALRIQKVFRGFFVRKSLRKIKEIKSKVDEIEARLSREEVVEMIRGNEREKLRMSEGLMNLLLKLDGIRGFDSGIRVCRKGVTRKAIVLQEKIDAICAPDSVGSQGQEDGIPAAELVGIELSPENGVEAELEGSGFKENSENSDDVGEESKGMGSVIRGCEKMEVERDFVLREKMDETETGTLKNIDFDEDDEGTVKEMLVQCSAKDMISGVGEEDAGNRDCEFRVNSESVEMLADVKEEHTGGDDVELEKETLEVERNLVGVLVPSVVEVTTKTCPVQETPKNLDFHDCDAETVKQMLTSSDGHEENKPDSSEESKGGDLRMDVERPYMDAVSADIPVAAVKVSQETLEEEDLNKRKCELLERMMEENKKMMLTMTQLYERNEMQLQMLDALTNRVKLLEKAYLCDKLRNRRKKLKKNKCFVNCIDE